MRAGRSDFPPRFQDIVEALDRKTGNGGSALEVGRDGLEVAQSEANDVPQVVVNEARACAAKQWLILAELDVAFPFRDHAGSSEGSIDHRDWGEDAAVLSMLD